MYPMRITALAVTLVLTVSGCSNTEDTDIATAVAPSVGNPLLAYVPNDTAYLAGNLAPLPDTVVDRFLGRMSPVLAALQNELSAARTKLDNDGGSEHKSKELARALLEELDGNLNRDGLEKLGFSLRPNHAVYGMGVFPVFRIGLSDAQAFRDTLQRLQDKSGFEIPVHEFQGKSYWRLGNDEMNHGDEMDHGGHSSGGAYLAVQDDHLAFTVFPSAAEAELLPAFLGIEMPADSDAEQRLAEINSSYGYQPYATALMDLHKMANLFLDPDPVMLAVLDKADGEPFTGLSDQCETEIRQIIDHAPRMVLGSTEISDNVLAFQYRVETESSLAMQLAGLVSGIPLIPEISSRVIEMAFGIKVGPLRDFVREKATAIGEMPFQCEQLQEINNNAAQFIAQMDEMPVPPLVNNFMGIRASLDQLPDDKMSPESLVGVMALHVDKPEMFVGMAQMFLPGLAELDITAGSAPVQIPENLAQFPGMVAFAAISDDAIGISVGEGQEAALPGYLDQSASNDGTVLALNYDSAAYMKFTRNMKKPWVSRCKSSSCFDFCNCRSRPGCLQSHGGKKSDYGEICRRRCSDR